MKPWPHNNAPSARHVWKETWTHPTNGNYSARCARCGRSYNAFADTRGPVYCVPTPAWLVEHPEDDGRAGVGDTKFAAMLGMVKP